MGKKTGRWQPVRLEEGKTTVSQQHLSRMAIERYYDLYHSGRQDKNWINWSWIAGRDRYYARCLDLLGVVAGRRLLDIAFGSGQLLSLTEARGLECWGVDISDTAIEKASSRVHASLQRLNVDEGLPYDENFFDYVTCLGSLEHFQEQSFVLREISRVCRPSGRICFFIPNDVYILHRLGYETDDQPVVKRYALDGWRSLIESNDMRVITTAKSNLHLLNLGESSSYLKLIGKIAIYPLVLLLPLRLSFSFWFVCEPAKK